MIHLISSAAEATANILNYRNFIDESSSLIENLSMNRAWYAVRDESGWHFGNSKVIGYANMHPRDYNSQELNGRQTEVVLQKWFTEVGPDYEFYDELWHELTTFLATYGKVPSKLARINVLTTEVVGTDGVRQDAVCNMIVEVAKGLHADQRNSLIQRLKLIS